MKKDISIQKDMIRCFVTVVFCAILMIAIYCGREIVHITKERREKMLCSQLDLVCDQLEKDFAVAFENTELFLYNEAIQNIMFQWSNTNQKQIDNIAAAEKHLRIIENQFGYRTVRLFVEHAEDYFIDAGSRFFNLKSLTAQIPVEIQIRDRKDQSQIIETYRYPTRKGDEYRLSVVRLLKWGAAENPSGAVCIDFDSSTLFSNWTEGMDSDIELLLLNQEGSVLASSQPELILTELDGALMESICGSDQVRDGEDIYLVSHFGYKNWQLCMRFPQSFWLEEILQLMFSMIAVALLMVTIFVVLVVLVSKRITGRLLEVTDEIKRGARIVRVPDMEKMYISRKSKDYREMAELIDAHNSLMTHVQNLTEINTEMIRSESRYRIEALRMQINSHFLYNTLASIKGYVEMQDVNMASDLLMELSSFFNHTLDRKGIFVSLGEEVMMVEKYLDIQQTVYEGMFEYQVDAEPEILGECVPHFILQPIIENALIHGAMQASGIGEIRLLLKQQGEILLVSVEDNGPGFARQMLANDRKPSDVYGIGMRNVYKRLMLYFGERAVMHWGNYPTGGSYVTIELHGGGLTEEERSTFDKDSFGR